ncbi:hypothetical protein KHA94_05520 [Bacillus sp. FJAT-49705]|uniref:Uncharacterized protein n=1 Tax=Cytobacillus citreus TaxID=2833586 RepID=A0ABS5NPB4_9BACI|nr:hypothetical protein [Cytobacillus citreus]MBS4189670.1 hypothetical protein [Cytobacillus citreus]
MEISTQELENKHGKHMIRWHSWIGYAALLFISLAMNHQWGRMVPYWLFIIFSWASVVFLLPFIRDLRLKGTLIEGTAIPVAEVTTWQ